VGPNSGIAISHTGYWHGVIDANGLDEFGNHQHYFDESLAQELSTFLTTEETQRLVDFGCGRGDYVKFLQGEGFLCDGYDGNPYTPSISNGLCKVLDLSQDFTLPKTYEWIISLEVAEHLPPQYEEAFVENLCNHSEKGIIISWAIEGQAGHGHFNCKNNDYVKEQFSQRGYTNDEEAENILRRASTLSWFENTIMVFRK